MKETVIELEGVGLTYGSGETAIEALCGIDLSVRRGELTLLLGPSGSGKTSLLQVMGCLLHASRGTVKLFGETVGGLDQEAMSERRLQHFGFIFQGYNLFPTLRAWENVALSLDLKGLPKRGYRKTAGVLLDRLGLQGRLDAFPNELSGGQKQRVAIARALAGSPSILLADEPTAALDGKTGQSVAASLQELAHAENCAVVVVTHDPRMLPYGDRVITLEDGRITGDHGQEALRHSGLSMESLLARGNGQAGTGHPPQEPHPPQGVF
ncbi:MAG: ABC transporter ATP-binding protein [Gammaproteobacteria bacterium]|nr:ABC transporter ATP-binding protein [Gammaproteobacteria bacterium]